MHKKSRRFGSLVLAAFMTVGLLAFSGCDAVEEKAKESASYVGDAANKVAEAAGEVTASWLGTTAANVGKSYNKSVVERLEYLEISVDKIDYKTKDKKKNYTIELTLNNTAPEDEKMYVYILLDDNYLIACDQNDYTYSLTSYLDPDDQYEYYDETIISGKSRLTVYTELDEADEIAYLQFNDKEISLP